MWISSSLVEKASTWTKQAHEWRKKNTSRWHATHNNSQHSTRKCLCVVVFSGRLCFFLFIRSYIFLLGCFVILQVDSFTFFSYLSLVISILPFQLFLLHHHSIFFFDSLFYCEQLRQGMRQNRRHKTTIWDFFMKWTNERHNSKL